MLMTPGAPLYAVKAWFDGENVGGLDKFPVVGLLWECDGFSDCVVAYIARFGKIVKADPSYDIMSAEQLAEFEAEHMPEIEERMEEAFQESEAAMADHSG